MDPKALEKRFRAVFEKEGAFKPFHHVSCFTYPMVPAIRGDDPGRISLITWGLIPSWTRDEASATKIRKMTFNARAETIHEKSSFRESVAKRRCLIPVDGFFEWTHQDEKKYPFFIKLRSSPIFALAGIWDAWTNPATKEDLTTFSIVTVKANPMMAKIHNSKERMPVILKPEDEPKWLSPALAPAEIDSLLTPYDESGLEAWSVALPSRRKGAPAPRPGTAHEVHKYPELAGKDLPGY